MKLQIEGAFPLRHPILSFFFPFSHILIFCLHFRLSLSYRLMPLYCLLEEIVAGVYDHVTVTGVVHKLPVSGESVVGYIPGRGQVEGLFSNSGADTCEVSLCSKEHGDETGFANTSCPEKKKFIISVRNVAFS